MKVENKKIYKKKKKGNKEIRKMKTKYTKICKQDNSKKKSVRLPMSVSVIGADYCLEKQNWQRLMLRVDKSRKKVFVNRKMEW